MKRSIYIIAVVLLLPLGTSAQKIEEYSSKLQMRFGFGITVSATKLFDNSRITDYALGYKSNYAYGQLLNISYFPWKRFGFEFNARHPLAYVGNFDKRVEAAYPGYLLLEKDNNESVANADYDLLFVYRYEKNRFYIYPKLSVGAVIICSQRFAYTFKMENSNELYQVIYKKSTPRASLSLGTSV
ncbi:hypothetical protein [uncultured Alistipes sp.]|jgi:hypothetical protein|uniref:hypothetical protein n=1 Tax=uncultured Alistipes sp. TaxID=538949 RepID=UPI0025D9F516|nr:hypothetical protein [uncultured Alistipes sp.]